MRLSLVLVAALVGCGSALAATETSSIAAACDPCPGAYAVSFTYTDAGGPLRAVNEFCSCGPDAGVMTFDVNPILNVCGAVYSCDPTTIDPCIYEQCMFAALCRNGWAKEDPPRCFPDGGLPPGH